MPGEAWFWLIVNGVLMAVCVWQAHLHAVPEDLIRFTSDIGTKEGDHASDQKSP
jgi:hypothetical protein